MFLKLLLYIFLGKKEYHAISNLKKKHSEKIGFVQEQHKENMNSCVNLFYFYFSKETQINKNECVSVLFTYFRKDTVEHLSCHFHTKHNNKNTLAFQLTFQFTHSNLS